MKELPNMLLVAGTSRNVGKTTFACKVIEQICPNQNVVGIKITPHFHAIDKTCINMFEKEGVVVYEEKNKTTTKDSSRMLAAGASKVYFIQAADEKIIEALEYLIPLIPSDVAIVCESAAIRKYVVPGFFILMTRGIPNSKNAEFINMIDFQVVDFDDRGISLNFKDGKWSK